MGSTCKKTILQLYMREDTEIQQSEHASAIPHTHNTIFIPILNSLRHFNVFVILYLVDSCGGVKGLIIIFKKTVAQPGLETNARPRRVKFRPGEWFVRPDRWASGNFTGIYRPYRDRQPSTNFKRIKSSK